MDPAGEGGLLGLAITKDEKTVFAYYTAANDNRIVSMSWDGRELGTPKVILRGIPKGFIHNGGRMVVGPDDYLYVGTGESGTGRLSQNKDSLGGKILRIRLDGRPAPGQPVRQRGLQLRPPQRPGARLRRRGPAVGFRVRPEPLGRAELDHQGCQLRVAGRGRVRQRSTE